MVYVVNAYKIKEVNVGGMRYNESRKRLSKAVSVTTEEEEAFKKLIKKDMKVFIQMIPKSDETMMKNLLK